MIVKRKTFASKNAINDRPSNVIDLQAEGAMIELIKIIEFYDRETNMKHWIIEEIIGRYLKESVYPDYNETTFSDVFARAIESNLPRRYKGFIGSSGIPFIESVLNKFKPGKEQYRKYQGSYKTELENMTFDAEFYQRAAKYIALSLTEQINPEHMGFWDNDIYKAFRYFIILK
jgi:hypothetical protein